MAQSYGNKVAFGLAVFGVAMPLLGSPAAIAQSADVAHPAFSRLADRITAMEQKKQTDDASLSLAEPMYVEEVLPPRRPSPRITPSRDPARAAADVQNARPPEPARSAARRNSLCATDRCPNMNMIGIQY